MNPTDNQINNKANTQIYNQGILPIIIPISIAIFIANIFLFSFFCHGHDVLHYYRADPLFSEPRFEKPWLASLDIGLGSGYTSTAFNNHGKKVNILNIYDLPKKHENKMAQKGSFVFHEINIAYTQNFNYGLFIKAHLPLRTDTFFIHTITGDSIQNRDDQLATDQHIPGQKKENIFEPGPSIIATQCIKNTDAGDLSIMAGWTINYQKPKTLDFVDITLKAGILFPTGQQKNFYPFSVPHGYDGLWGIPISADIAIGCYEWLTIGSHLEILPLWARHNPITYGRVGMYSKADHIMHGLSLLLGYTYSNKNSSHALSKKIGPTTTKPEIEPWSMHTIHFALEYDLTEYDSFLGPRIGFFIDTPVYGKNIFKTTMSGIFLGLEIAT